jgi:hypothetical protein
MEKIFGRLVYSIQIPNKEVESSQWASVPAGMRLVEATTLAEALRSETSSHNGSYRLESVGGHFGILRIRKDHHGIQVSAEHICTINGEAKDKVLYVGNKRAWGDVEFDQFLVRVQDRIGKMPPTKLSTNTIKYLREFCFSHNMNRQGGTYFVPERRLKVWDEYKVAMENCGLTIYEVEVYKSGMNLSAIKEAAKIGFMDQIEDAMKKLETLKTERGFESRIDQIEATFGEVELYEGILEVRLEDVREALKLAKENLKKGLGKLASSK